MQRSLGGHAIPLDAPTLRCVRRLGLLDERPGESGGGAGQPGTSGAQAEGPRFTDALSDLAEAYCWEDVPHCHGCPLSADCATAQEGGVAPQAAADAPAETA